LANISFFCHCFTQTDKWHSGKSNNVGGVVEHIALSLQLYTLLLAIHHCYFVPTAGLPSRTAGLTDREVMPTIAKILQYNDSDQRRLLNTWQIWLYCLY